MVECYCKTCHRKIDTTKEKLWTDDASGLSFAHSRYQCKECYSLNHKFCPKCKDQPLLMEWKHCPKCGTKV